MKKRLHLFLCALLLVSSSLAYSKPTELRRCATVDMDAKRRLANPELGTNADFEAWLENVILTKSKASLAVKSIPVVFHVIHNGEAVGSGDNIADVYINAQLDQLNNDFRKKAGTSGDNNHSAGADTEVEFTLAAINRVDRNTKGFSAPPYTTDYVDATIKGATVWNPDQYCNIWVVTMSGGILGYAQFPSQSGLDGMPSDGGSANTDGVVVLGSSMGSTETPNPAGGSYNKGRTLTHEIGHWLGLRHIWGDGGCGVDDFVADTPESDAANYGCTPSSSCGSSDMIQNYMDYTDDSCMNVFTNGQKTRIQAVMANSLRRQFGTPSGNQSPTANFSFTTTNLTANFTDNSSDSDGTVASRSWNFGDGNTSTTTNPSHTYSSAGNYTVTLTVTDNEGATGTYNASVTVADTTSSELGNGDSAANVAASSGAWKYFTTTVPSNASNLVIKISGGTGDADLYTRFGSQPTESNYNCRPYQSGNNETCSETSPSAGTWHIGLRAYSTFSGVTVSVSWTDGSANQAPTANFTHNANDLAVSFTDASTDADGSIASYSWNFGDGSTSTTANPTHTYAAAGTYTVSLKVTDNDGASNTTQKDVTVANSTGGDLSNGETVPNLSGSAGEWTYFTVTLPAGASNFTVSMSGGTGDADLYTRFGAQPTTGTYECRPYKTGNAESCTVASPSAGTWHIGIRGYSAYSGASLTVNWSTGDSCGIVDESVSGLSGNSGSWQVFTIVVPECASNLTISMSGGSGDADLYTRFGSAPTTSTYDCRPYKSGNTENCNIANPAAGTYHIAVRGYSTFSGVNLTIKAE